MGSENSKPTYQLLESKVVGKGSFGTVYEGRHSRSQERVAIKKCDVITEKQADIVREIKSVQHIDTHKHICKFLDFQYENNAFLLVMEYCDRGDLTMYMKKYAPNLDAQIKIMHQCTSAVQYMHSVYVINRNIKPANILFRTEGKSVVAKLCDFGLAKTTDNTDSAMINRRSLQATKAFMAPELYAGKSYDRTVDNFAMALIFLVMINYNPAIESMFPMTATHLTSGNEELKSVGEEMHEARSRGAKMPAVTIPRAGDSASLKGVKKLILAMSEADPSKRMALTQVLSELEKLATVNSSDYSRRSKKHAALFNSNLDITKTRAGFDAKSMPTITESGGSEHNTKEGDSGTGSKRKSETRDGSVRSQGSAKTSPRKDKPQEQKSVAKTEVAARGSSRHSEVKDEETEQEDGTEPDIGYLLMRQMIEEHVGKKREQELREKRAQQEAHKLAAALPLLILVKLLESDSENAKNFAKGDKVKIDPDYEKAQQLQVNHGGWQDRMKPYLGKIGTVTDVDKGKIKVKFSNGESLMWNAHLLEKVDDRTAAAAAIAERSKFKRHDNVRVKVDLNTLKRVQDSCSAGWREGMSHIIGLRGVVQKIDKDLHVFVDFLNGDTWWIHPAVLETVNLSGVELEAGDIVIILDDKAKVKQLQKGHGDWVEQMSECLGKSGVVKRVTSNGRAVVEVDKYNFIWNIKCCKLVAKSEELVLVMLREHLLGK